MWFKNAYIFRLTKTKFFSQLNLEQLLSEHKFRECGSTEQQTFGWASALRNTENLVHSVENNNYQLIRSCKSTKSLPVDFVRREMDKKIATIETEQCRRATKKEKEQLKEDIIFEHLATTPPSHSLTNIYLDNVNELIIIDSASKPIAEDILALLRKCIGTLPVTSYFNSALQQCLDDWVSGQRDIEEQFKLGWNVQLSAFGDSPAQARFTNEEVTTKHITSLINDDDREVNYLGLEFDETFSFTLDAKGFLKGLKPFDVLKEQNEDINSDDTLERIDADFVLFAKEMSRLFYSFKALEITDETDKEVFDASSVKSIEVTEEAKPALEETCYE